MAFIMGNQKVGAAKIWGSELEMVQDATINKLKEALEEIANGHLQELVSEAIARQVLEELD